MPSRMRLFVRSALVWREPKPGAQDIWKKYLELREQHGENDNAIEGDLQDWYRGLPKDHPAKALSRYKHVDRFGPWRDRDISWPGGGGPRYDVIHPKTGKPCSVPERGWGFSSPEAMQRQIKLGLVVFREDHTQPPFRKAHLRPIPDELDEENGVFTNGDEEEGSVGMQVMPSVLYKQSQVAVKYLRNLMGVKSFDNPKDHELLARIIGYTTSPDRQDLVVDFFAGSGTTAQAVLASNLRDEGNRRYLLVEMGDYFETLLKPRIQKVVFAADWRDGKPVAGSVGQSHMFQYIRLESYEDALNNVRFRTETEPDLLATLHAMPDYMLHYMLDYETAGSPGLLDLAQFDHPFDYKLNITHHDATEPQKVDLVTTFNFLLGLRVRTYRRLQRDGRPVVRVTGEDGRGRRVCVLWRDVPGLDEMEAEKAWLQEHALHGVAYDLLYVNGESALPDALPIEPEFQRLMFEPVTGKGG